MVINIANFNFGGDGGGGGKPALLQEKTATIVQNGSQTITPDEGFDGMSSVQINAAITGDSSAIDFSSIGYSDEFSAEVNAKLNDYVAYSKTLYDAWDPSRNIAGFLYSYNTKLVIAFKNYEDNYMLNLCKIKFNNEEAKALNIEMDRGLIDIGTISGGANNGSTLNVNNYIEFELQIGPLPTNLKSELKGLILDIEYED